MALRLGTNPLESYKRINPRATKAKLEQYKRLNGLSDNYVIGYFNLLKNFVTFNWPRSDRKSTRLNSSHEWISRMPSSA